MRDKETPERNAAIVRFWEKYIHVLHKQGINEPVDRWYVIRAQAFVEAFPEKRLAEREAPDLTEYLGALGRKTSLQDWQFAQAADAIRILLVEMAGLEWARSFDWAFWRGSARTLDNSHATVARDYGESPWRGKQEEGERHCQEIRRKQPETFRRLVAEIRKRGYSIRTEQAYEGWACRFVGFHDLGDPASMGPAEVLSFLER